MDIQFLEEILRLSEEAKDDHEEALSILLRSLYTVAGRGNYHDLHSLISQVLRVTLVHGSKMAFIVQVEPSPVVAPKLPDGDCDCDGCRGRRFQEAVIRYKQQQWESSIQKIFPGMRVFRLNLGKDQDEP